MEWNQILTIIGVNIALFAAIAGLIIYVMNRVDSDVKSVGDRIDKIGDRMDRHAQRIDQLYKMFVDLLKDRKNP